MTEGGTNPQPGDPIWPQTLASRGVDGKEIPIPYRTQATNITNNVNKSLSLEAQVKQAFDLRNSLTDGAAAALYDGNLRAVFLDAFKLQPLEKIYAKVIASTPEGLSGDALQRAVLKEIATVDAKRFAFESTACFAKGTLVHAKEGLVPIEKLKVGDLVLSRPEGGGELDYKPVTRTFVHPPTLVVRLVYQFESERNQVSFLTTTLNHPFWAVGEGWTKASDLHTWPGEESRLELMDGRQMLTCGRKRIYRTNIPNVGWISRVGDVRDEIGDELDCENNTAYRREIYAGDNIRNDEDAELLEIPVYNIEVADFHTYFVGKEGVWVHNKNADAAIQVTNGGAALPESMPVFFTETELLRYVADKNITSGYVIVKAGQNSQAAYLENIFPWLYLP